MIKREHKCLEVFWRRKDHGGGENDYSGTWSYGIKLTKGKGLLNINKSPSVFLWHHLPREVAGAPSLES